MALTSTTKGVLFDFQGFSVHDGPGCRSVVFMKGCPLQCQWCANPEGISFSYIPLYDEDKCLQEGDCIKACPSKAIVRDNNRIKINRISCQSCQSHACAETCPSGALRITGYEQSIDQLYSKIIKDRDFWGINGGVTFSGGEPLLQLDFMTSILEKCYDACIHTALETCGQVPWSHFDKVIPYLDWIFFDLKHLNPSKHKEGTGKDNLIILENARQLPHVFEGRLIFRVPLIPSYNDSAMDLHDIAEFIKSTGRSEVNLLPLHHWGKEKYVKLQEYYHLEHTATPTGSQMQKAQDIFNTHRLKCYLGADTPF